VLKDTHPSSLQSVEGLVTRLPYICGGVVFGSYYSSSTFKELALVDISSQPKMLQERGSTNQGSKSINLIRPRYYWD